MTTPAPTAVVTTIRPVRVNHINIVVEELDAAVAHLRDGYGARFMFDLPSPVWHACLIETGRVILELFEPPAFLLNARYGPHYLGIEYQADMDVARAAIAQRGIRVARDIGSALHTHPADTFGIAFEFYAGQFHDNPQLGGDRMQSADWWRDTHPLGLTGLAGYTVAVRDIAGARAFFESFLGATLLDEAERPGVAGHAVRLQVADSWVELLSPIGEGMIEAHLRRFGDGIYSIVFGARDLDQLRRHLAGQGITLTPGSALTRLAAPAGRELGVILEWEV